MKKILTIIGWVITAPAAGMLLFSTYGKFFNPEMAQFMETFGVGDWRIYIACGELVGTLLFLIPKTSKFGMLLLSAHMGGAIVIHMSNGQPFMMQSVVLGCVWIAGILRNWEFYKS